MKNLTETCSTFNNILGFRLGLAINFDKLPNIENLPEIKRPYKSIRICGTDVDPMKIPEILASSSSSARNLTVESVRRKFSYPILSKMHSHALLKMLQQLPQIESLKLDGVRVSQPKFPHEEAAFDEGPVLSQLKEVNVQDCNEEIFQCIWNAENVETINIELQLRAHPLTIYPNLMRFLDGQDRLESLTTEAFVPDFGLPKLKKLTLKCPISRNKPIYCRLIQESPMLESLSLNRFTHTNLEAPTAEDANLRFLRDLKSSSLTTLILNIGWDEFDLARTVLMDNQSKNLPSLKVARSTSGLAILEL